MHELAPLFTPHQSNARPRAKVKVRFYVLLLLVCGLTALGVGTVSALAAGSAMKEVGSSLQSLTANSAAVRARADAIMSTGYQAAGSTSVNSGQNAGAGAAAPLTPCQWDITPSADAGYSSSELKAIKVVSPTDAWAVGDHSFGSASKTLTEHWNGTSWDILPSPNLGYGANTLTGVSVLSDNDVWAVGYYDGGSSYNLTLAMHWDGSQWSVTSTPNTANYTNALQAVAAVSSNDVWAVGSYPSGDGSALILHWDGTAWSYVVNPAGVASNSLYSIYAISASDIWAVGRTYDGSGYLTLTEHWNGSAWSIVSSPNPDPSVTVLNSLVSVSAVSSNDVWAVGTYGDNVYTLIIHWNGVQWNLVPSPNPGYNLNYLTSVTAASANSVWAPGTYQDGVGIHPMVEHWNGSQWSAMPLPSDAETVQPYGIGASSPSDVWMVGYHCDNCNYRRALVEHWNGNQWSITPGTDVSGQSGLLGVSVSQDGAAWAVGTYADGSVKHPLAEQWNGSQWTVTESATQSPYDHSLQAVASVSSGNVWAVGNYCISAGCPLGDRNTLIQHWDGGAWSIVPSPNVSGVNNTLSAITVVSANDVWAAGYASQPLMLHWNGTLWSIVSAPNPPDGTGYINGISAVASNDVWAVGYADLNTGVQHTMALHWNGTAWSLASVPNVGVRDNSLSAVTAISSNDVWAVGHTCAGSNCATSQTLTVHWNGTAWSVVSSPNPSAHQNALEGVAALSSGDITAVGHSCIDPCVAGGSEQTMVLHWNGTAWSVQSSPNANVNNYLYAAAPSPNGDIWAVGYSLDATHYDQQTLTLRYSACNPPSPTATATGTPPTATPTRTASPTRTSTSTSTATETATYTSTPPSTATFTCGLSWRVLTSPNNGPLDNQLTDVSVVSPSDIWAVGYDDTWSFLHHTLIIHWNGTSWAEVSSPNPSEYDNELNGVVAVSASDVWAVGSDGMDPDFGDALILHWDGTSWSQVQAPANSERLADVQALSANNIWAVGGNTLSSILHWDGSHWSIVSSPNPGNYENILKGATIISTNDIWAVGTYYNDGCCAGHTLTMHWNGSQWSTVTSPDAGGNSSTLSSVAAVSSNDVWAVGDGDTTGSYPHLTLIEHWNGSAWSIVSSPNETPGADYLYSVYALSANDVWAVGRYENGSSFTTLAMHWDGTAWSLSPAQSPGQFGNSLNGVAAVSANDILAVGFESHNSRNTLVERFSDPCASATPSATPTSTGTGTVIATSTPTATGSPPVSTATNTRTHTASPTVAATGTVATATTVPTGSTTSTVTSTVVASGTPLATGTSISTSTPHSTGTVFATATQSAVPSSTATACSIEFTDVLPGSTFYSFVECMACRGIITGYTSGCDTGSPCFRPQTNVTRGQLSKIVSLAAGFSEDHTTQTFTDVPLGSTFYQYVERMASRGITGGYACGGAGEPCDNQQRPYFRPNANATRGQIAKIDVLAAVQSLGWTLDNPATASFEDVAVGSTFYQYVETAVGHAVLGGYPCGGAGEPCGPSNLPYFRPNSNASRGQTSKIVSNSFFPNCQALGFGD